MADPLDGKGVAKDGERKSRHPLPESPEARHNEIPETDEREKGLGEEGDELVQPNGMPVDPGGDTYVFGDLGRQDSLDRTGARMELFAAPLVCYGPVMKT